MQHSVKNEMRWSGTLAPIGTVNTFTQLMTNRLKMRRRRSVLRLLPDVSVSNRIRGDSQLLTARLLLDQYFIHHVDFMLHHPLEIVKIKICWAVLTDKCSMDIDRQLVLKKVDQKVPNSTCETHFFAPLHHEWELPEIGKCSQCGARIIRLFNGVKFAHVGSLLYRSINMSIASW